MTAQTWIEKRASEIATERERLAKEKGEMAVLDWSKLFFLALCEYLDECGIRPPCDNNEQGHLCPEHQ